MGCYEEFVYEPPVIKAGAIGGGALPSGTEGRFMAYIGGTWVSTSLWKYRADNDVLTSPKKIESEIGFITGGGALLNENGATRLQASDLFITSNGVIDVTFGMGGYISMSTNNGITPFGSISLSTNSLRLNIPSKALGKVLTSDGNGYATWETPSSVNWGAIGGTLDAQSDLWLLLGAKAPITHTHDQSQIDGLITTLADKQATLTNGVTIKTINSVGLLGSGDISVQATLVSGTNIKTINSTSLLGSGDISVQATLVSGTNIKTINSTSLLGSGDIVVGLTGFTASLNTATPNNTVNASRLLASGGSTNQDIVLSPKGTGGLLASLPTATATGGNKRGLNTVDWQTSRSLAAQVASGDYSSILGGGSNTASGIYAIVGGYANSVVGDYSFGFGNTNIISAPYSLGAGTINTIGAAASSSFVIGDHNDAQASNSLISGSYSNTVANLLNNVALGHRLTSYLHGQKVLSNNYTASKSRQNSFLSAQGQTTNITATEVYLDASSYRIVLKNNTAYSFDIDVIAQNSASPTQTAKFCRTGLIYRGATAGTTALEGSVQTIGSDVVNAGLTGIAVTFSADTTNGSLKLSVTGLAATTINWQLRIMLVELEN